jgi:hypothetical protein
MSVESYIERERAQESGLTERERGIKNERTYVGERVFGISRENVWPCGYIWLPCKSTLVRNRTRDKNVFFCSFLKCISLSLSVKESFTSPLILAFGSLN